LMQLLHQQLIYLLLYVLLYQHLLILYYLFTAGACIQKVEVLLSKHVSTSRGGKNL
jgi:hypothetical protein